MRKKCMALAVVSLLLCGCRTGSIARPYKPVYVSPGSVEGPRRVGTFRRTDLLVAYYGSQTHDKLLRRWKADYKRAEKAGDKKTMARIEAEGSRLQDVAHRQLAGKASLTNIFAHLSGALPEVARQAEVYAIAEEGRRLSENAEMVDVTEWLVKQFTPARRGRSGSRRPKAKAGSAR